jgi:hypothetical protein
MSAQEPIEVVDDEDVEGFGEVNDEFANSSRQLGTYIFRGLRDKTLSSISSR